jgi:hypothetical protein
MKAALDLGEEMFEFHHMMEHLIGNHRLVWFARFPLIEVTLDKLQVIQHSGFRGQSATTLEHGGGAIHDSIASAIQRDRSDPDTVLGMIGVSSNKRQLGCWTS